MLRYAGGSNPAGNVMKGVIFTELVGFFDARYDLLVSDAIIERAALPNAGAFTSVGNYPSGYALTLLGAASELRGEPVDILCQDYGSYLFTRFGVLFPSIMAKYATAEALLDHVGSHIHQEVIVLYSDAQPPKITTRHDGDTMTVDYESHRPMAHIAYGLIRKCLRAYGDPRQVHWQVAATATTARFVISLRPVVAA